MLKVISASRRTDIPAFYSEWFMSRIRAGYVRFVNPFSKAVCRASLRPKDVAAIVFWSKNYQPLLPHLDELDAGDYRMLFHFTVNGLPSVFEPNVADVGSLVECARTLSRRYGSETVLWRYDPVLISSITSSQYHLTQFEKLCGQLEGAITKCYFSFTVFHRKVVRNAEILSNESDIVLYDLPRDDRIELANALASIASQHGIQMHSCCGDYLLGEKVKKAYCTDGELLHRLFTDKVGSLETYPTRNECGCCQCTDIGAYDTCIHGCVYCYANSNLHTALRNHQEQDRGRDILIGNPRPARAQA